MFQKFFFFLAMRLANENFQFTVPEQKQQEEEHFEDFYATPIETPLNSGLFEDKLIIEPKNLPETPPALPVLSPLPLSPQKTNTYIQQTENETMCEKDTITQPFFLTETQQCDEYMQQFSNELTATDQTTQSYLNELITIDTTEQEIMETITTVLASSPKITDFYQSANRRGKDISLLKKQYVEEEQHNSTIQEEEEEEEEEEKEELRTTTKNNKRFHKHLIFKKKDEVLKKFPILSQKNSDLVVNAENKFKELKSIFILKKKYIEKNKELKEHIFGLELIAHRYRCETERLDKKKKGKINIFF